LRGVHQEEQEGKTANTKMAKLWIQEKTRM
jgi:hypothetical protein